MLFYSISFFSPIFYSAKLTKVFKTHFCYTFFVSLALFISKWMFYWFKNAKRYFDVFNQYCTSQMTLEISKTLQIKKLIQAKKWLYFNWIGKTKETEFQCGVYSPNDKFTPLKSNPGEMIWKLGNKMFSKSNEYEKVNVNLSWLLLVGHNLFTF